MIRPRSYALAFAFLLTAAHLSAQSGLQFERIDGLSQSTGYAIMKDRQGFLWIATADGLNRYDGVEMKVYKPNLIEEHGQMVGRVIRSEMHEDDQERIWFSTDVAVHSFDKKTERFAIYPLDVDGNPTRLFANPLMFEGDRLWLATATSGLFELDIKTKESKHYPLTLKDDAGNNILLMYNGVHDHRNGLWFATNKGLLRFDTREHQWTRYFQQKSFYSLAYASDTLYISEGKEVLKAAVSNLTEKYARIVSDGPVVERDFIHRVYADERNNIWFGDESGNVFQKPNESQEFKSQGNINFSTSIRTNYPVYSFYADTSGVLWTGAYMLGLMKSVSDRQEFHVFPQPDLNKVTRTLFVNTFYEDGEGKLWMGTFQNGIVILDKKTGVTRTFELPYTGPQLVYGKSVHIIKEDSKDNLWTGISGYLFVRENGDVSFKAIKIPSISNALQNPQVWCLAEYRNGWLFGTTIGLYFMAKENGQFTIKHLSWAGHGRVTDVFAGSDNEVWIAFESGGILVTIDPKNGTGLRRIFQDANIKSFHKDDRRPLLWICTTNGLIAYDLTSGSSRIFTEKDGLSNSYTYSVLQDEDNLWVSTNAGLFKATITSAHDNPLPEAGFISFTRSDGLPDNQFNSGSAFKSPGGELHFGTPSGIVWFDPRRIEPSRSAPQTVMVGMSVNGESADRLQSSSYIKTLLLPHSKNNLSFRFRGIEYGNPLKVQYAYQLENWDKDWINSGALNEARYNNLPPGDYRFKVRSANSSGVWDPDPYTVTVTIKPPFWKTWWFYGLTVSLLLASVIIITRRIAISSLQKKLAELERQRELDRERQRISREMHDDIGAGLTQITLISEFAKSRNPAGMDRELTEIAATSRQLVGSMSEIIWSLSPENRTLDQLLSYLREQLNKQLEYSRLEYSINFPQTSTSTMLSDETRRNILLVIKEIVNNAIKHSMAKSITVSAALDGSEIEFSIADDGTGFDVRKTYNGNGLKNIRERIGALGGTVHIESEPGRGSRFICRISLGKEAAMK